MAVARQEYSVSATWTSGQFANILRDAFVDAGYMTAWYDSFTSGSVENRILEIQYDGTKTYGKTYYWFMIQGGDFRMQLASGWNATTHVPTGTQYLDYISTATNRIGDHNPIMSLSTTINAKITRFTSQASSSHTWFLFTQGTSTKVFTISAPSHGVPSWIDLNKTMFHHFLRIFPQTSSRAAFVTMQSWELIRRSAIFGPLYKDHTSYGYAFPVSVYAAFGRSSNDVGSNASGFAYDGINSTPNRNTQIILPIYEASVNPAFSADVNPVFTCLPMSLYLTNSNMPSDLGIVFYYADNTMVVGDRFIVDAGVEEWEILAVANNAVKTSGASSAVVARVV